MVPTRCWCHQCRRRWRERCTSCRPSGFIRSMCRLPQRSAFSRNGAAAPVSSSGLCKRRRHRRSRRRQPDRLRLERKFAHTKGQHREGSNRIYRSSRRTSLDEVLFSRRLIPIRSSPPSRLRKTSPGRRRSMPTRSAFQPTSGATRWCVWSGSCASTRPCRRTSPPPVTARP